MEQEKTTNENSGYTESRSRKALAGMIVVCVGIVLFLKQLGIEFPFWLFTWKTLLITIGLFIGAKHGFKSSAWVIVVMVGAAFLLEDLIPGINISQFFWPIIIIAIGLIIIFKPKRHFNWDRHQSWGKHHHWNKAEWKNVWEKDYSSKQETYNAEDQIDSTTIFGNVRKVILSKNFKGGEVVNLFGGAEINLSQADINGTVILDVTQVFGGCKIILPPHWEVRCSEMVAVFGGIEDKRPPQEKQQINPEKVLIIRGTSVFAGIEFKSF